MTLSSSSANQCFPALHEQPGYDGVYVLLSPEGQALVLTFWESEEAADAGLAGRQELLRRASREVRDALHARRPGATTYEVVLAEAPTAVH